MADPRPAYRGVQPRDMDAALTLLGQLNAHGAPVASLTVTPDELVAETPPTITPPQGIALLRELEDDPDRPVIVRRHPGKVDLIARVLRRSVRLRVARHGND
jgi:hypothetical protein